MAEQPPIANVVDRALALIRPQPKQRAACIADIGKVVEMLRKVAAWKSPPPPGTLKDESPPPGVLKGKLQDIHAQLVETRKLMRGSPQASALIFSATFPSQIPPADPKTGFPATRPLFLDLLDGLIDAAEFSRDSLVVPRGSKPWDIVKAQAVFQAKTLLAAHGPAKPKRGVADKLASLLYEAITGETGVNLRQYRRSGDRANPGIVMRVQKLSR
jgi:hypothetical protein